MGIPRMLAWVILLGMFAFAFATYGTLPESIPTGLDANGQPRGMREKSLLVWLMLPLISLAVTAPVITEMQLTLDIAAAASLLPMAYIQFLMWQTAVGKSMPLGIVGVIVGSVFVTPVILIAAGRVTSATEAAEKRWKADGAPTE